MTPDRGRPGTRRSVQFRRHHPHAQHPRRPSPHPLVAHDRPAARDGGAAVHGLLERGTGCERPCRAGALRGEVGINATQIAELLATIRTSRIRGPRSPMPAKSASPGSDLHPGAALCAGRRAVTRKFWPTRSAAWPRKWRRANRPSCFRPASSGGWISSSACLPHQPLHAPSRPLPRPLRSRAAGGPGRRGPSRSPA